MVSPETVLLDTPKSQKNLRTSKEKNSKENRKLLKTQDNKKFVNVRKKTSGKAQKATLKKI
jgi:hypothetical protein